MGANGDIRVFVTLDLCQDILYRRSDVVIPLDLFHELLLSLFNHPIDGTLGFLIVLMDGLAFGTVDESELLPYSLKHLISAATKLQRFALLADLCALFLR